MLLKKIISGGQTGVDQAALLRPKPVWKWVGGKRKLLPQILARLPDSSFDGHRYFEPFVGGGAVFFEMVATGRLSRLPAHLSDMNADLTNAYVVVKRDVAGLISHMRDPAMGYVCEEKAYYRIRALDPNTLSPVRKAARFLYLNKTCFNGLYRVNKSGGFNVPFGRYDDPTICDEAVLLAASAALQHTTIRCVDFVTAMEDAQAGDVAYFDPPYLPLSATSDFTSYTSDGFGLGDHERLRDLLLDLRGRGVHWLLSNSAAPAIKALYDRREFVVEEVMMARAINSKGSKRGKIAELLISPRTRK